MKPNLFIVGAAKSGTTSLHSYLRSHPQIYMSEPKEPHYFCTDFHRSSDLLKGTQSGFGMRSKEDYLALFEGVNDSKLVGEASASYLHSKEAASNIRVSREAASVYSGPIIPRIGPAAGIESKTSTNPAAPAALTARKPSA